MTKGGPLVTAARMDLPVAGRIVMTPAVTVIRGGPERVGLSAIPAQGYDLKDIQPHGGRWRSAAGRSEQPAS